MDYAAGFVAMQVHDVNVRRAEERIAIERSAAERAEGAERAAWLRTPRRHRVRRHAPLLAR